MEEHNESLNNPFYIYSNNSINSSNSSNDRNISRLGNLILNNFISNMNSTSYNNSYNRSENNVDTSFMFDVILSAATDVIVNHMEDYLDQQISQIRSVMLNNNQDVLNESYNDTIDEIYRKNNDICIDSCKKIYDKKDNNENCTICFETIEENAEIADLECKHLFHFDCINDWVKRKPECPNCKSSIKIKNSI